MANHQNPPTVGHHEESDVNIRAIFGFGAGLIVVAGVIHVLIWLLFMYFNSAQTAGTAPQYPLAAESGSRLPPEPRLQTTPREDLQELRRQEQEWLSGYGWVDRNAGVVHIPVNEAMRLTLERGLPARTGQPGASATRATTPTAASAGTAKPSAAAVKP